MCPREGPVTQCQAEGLRDDQPVALCSEFLRTLYFHVYVGMTRNTAAVPSGPDILLSAQLTLPFTALPQKTEGEGTAMVSIGRREMNRLKQVKKLAVPALIQPTCP